MCQFHLRLNMVTNHIIIIKIGTFIFSNSHNPRNFGARYSSFTLYPFNYNLALATAICSYLQVTILILMLRKRFEQPVLTGITPILLKTTVATMIMFLTGWLALRLMADMPFNKKFDLLRLISTVAICTGTYVILAKIMKNKMLSLIIHRKNPAK